MIKAAKMRSSSSALPLSASFPLQGKRRQEALLLDRILTALLIAHVTDQREIEREFGCFRPCDSRVAS